MTAPNSSFVTEDLRVLLGDPSLDSGHRRVRVVRRTALPRAHKHRLPVERRGGRVVRDGLAVDIVGGERLRTCGYQLSVNPLLGFHC